MNEKQKYLEARSMIGIHVFTDLQTYVLVWAEFTSIRELNRLQHGVRSTLKSGGGGHRRSVTQNFLGAQLKTVL